MQRLPASADGRLAELDAVLLLFTADFPPPLPITGEILDGFGPVAHQIPPDAFAALDRAVTELDVEYRTLQNHQDPDGPSPGPADTEYSTALLRQLLGALLIRIARLDNLAANDSPSSAATASAATAATADTDTDTDTRAGAATSTSTSTSTSGVYHAFRRELEQSFATTRSVEDFAARLGYSPRTLTRACLAATGRTAKQLADARVTLQAQRLLAHTDQPVAAIGHALGFTEATNFGKFFARQTGQTPGDFRRTQR